MLWLLLLLAIFLDGENPETRLEYTLNGKGPFALYQGAPVPAGVRLYARQAVRLELAPGTILGLGRGTEVELSEGSVQLLHGRAWFKGSAPTRIIAKAFEVVTEGEAELFIEFNQQSNPARAWVKAGLVKRSGEPLATRALPYNPKPDSVEEGGFRCGNEGPKTPFAWLTESAP